jgi:hypothetical protein
VPFVHVYTSLVYLTCYSFFEAFPLVYIDIYGFNEGQLGLTFLAIVVGAVLGYAGYFAHLLLVINPSIMKNGLAPQEERLVPAIYASFLFPMGLFVFGWSARRKVHWIISIIGLGLDAAGFNVSAYPNVSISVLPLLTTHFNKHLSRQTSQQYGHPVRSQPLRLQRPPALDHGGCCDSLLERHGPGPWHRRWLLATRWSDIGVCPGALRSLCLWDEAKS